MPYGSTFTQVMACCLRAPSHYLNQCWCIITVVLWHSPKSNFTRNAHELNPQHVFEDYTFELLPYLPGANELNFSFQWDFCIISYIAAVPCFFPFSQPPVPAICVLWGSASRSVSVACRNDPVREKLVPLSLYCTWTASFSRFCFFSRQIAKAQPTAWLSRSPWKQQPGHNETHADFAQGSAFFNEQQELKERGLIKVYWFICHWIQENDSKWGMSPWKLLLEPLPRCPIFNQVTAMHLKNVHS